MTSDVIKHDVFTLFWFVYLQQTSLQRDSLEISAIYCNSVEMMNQNRHESDKQQKHNFKYLTKHLTEGNETRQLC